MDSPPSVQVVHLVHELNNLQKKLDFKMFICNSCKELVIGSGEFTVGCSGVHIDCNSCVEKAFNS